MQFVYISLVLPVFVASIKIDGANQVYENDDRLVPKYAELCLANSGLNIDIFGINEISELTVESYQNLRYLDENTRNCFTACIFLQKGMITYNGTLSKNLPSTGPPEKKYATTYRDAINTCRAEKNFCRLGGCLFEVYY